jgi:hypothetical protein
VLSPASLSISQLTKQQILVTNPVTGIVTTNTVPTIALSWLTNATGFVLESATNLNPPVVWSAATNAVSTNGADVSVTIIPSGLMSFYRLLFR